MEIEALIFIGGILLIILIIALENTPKMHAEVDFESVKIKAEVADTTLKQMKGLMFRKGLKEKEGMIFVFNNEDYHSIWMMNMSFPIDIIWINDDFEIVHIARNVQPCFINCPVYTPFDKARYVVEINANLTEKYNIEVGDFVDIKNS